MTYTITLQNVPAEITEHAQRDAEDRFRRTLEQWIAAATRDRNDGLWDLGEIEAHFKVRMER